LSSRILQLCYRYDTTGRRYFLDVTRLAGIATAAVLVLFGAGLALRRSRRGAGSGP
jgi:hypothetical protein